jgi:hypothetical protein
MIKFSILVIALIAVFITSSTTFTVAHAQQMPSHNLQGLTLAVIGIALTAIPLLIPTASGSLFGPNSVFPNVSPTGISGLIGQ